MVDARGGGPCTILTGRWYSFSEGDPPHVDAICFAGGSVTRIESASGVMAGLLERRKGLRTLDLEIATCRARSSSTSGRRRARRPPQLSRARDRGARRAQAGRFPRSRSRAARGASSVGASSGRAHLERSGQGGAFSGWRSRSSPVFSGRERARRGGRPRRRRGTRRPRPEERRADVSRGPTCGPARAAAGTGTNRR